MAQAHVNTPRTIKSRLTDLEKDVRRMREEEMSCRSTVTDVNMNILAELRGLREDMVHVKSQLKRLLNGNGGKR